jgi:hypothetical protein
MREMIPCFGSFFFYELRARGWIKQEAALTLDTTSCSSLSERGRENPKIFPLFAFWGVKKNSCT